MREQDPFDDLKLQRRQAIWRKTATVVGGVFGLGVYIANYAVPICHRLKCEADGIVYIVFGGITCLIGGGWCGLFSTLLVQKNLHSGTPK